MKHPAENDEIAILQETPPSGAQTLEMIGRLIVIVALVLGPTLAAASGADIPDSPMLEKELQSLSWPRFRYVVESIPKLRAEVDRHGQFGWQFVRANYRTYPWKKNIDKLDADQRHQLALLIRKATKTGDTALKNMAP